MRCIFAGFAHGKLVANLALARQEGHGGGGHLKRAHAAVVFGNFNVQRALDGLVQILNDKRAGWHLSLINHAVSETHRDGGISLRNPGDLRCIAAKRPGQHALIADQRRPGIGKGIKDSGLKVCLTQRQFRAKRRQRTEHIDA